MEQHIAVALLVAPFLFLQAMAIALCFAHILALLGVGEGTPWTTRAAQRFYKGDASPFVFALTLGSILAVALFRMT
jgi:hypothetical protein